MEASSSGSSSQSSDLFIVLEPFRTGFADFVRALEPLSNTTDGPLLGSSDVYYRADTDIALLTIRFDRQALTPQKLAWLTSVAARADLPVLDPGRLGFSDRRAFYEDYLPNYRVRVEARGGPQEALEELARLLGLPDAPPVRAPSSPTTSAALGSESSDRRGPHTSPRIPVASDPDGRYGAARSVGQGAGTRSVRRRGSSGISSLSRRPGTRSSTSPPFGAAKERQRALDYAEMSDPNRGRQRGNPPLTPDPPRLPTPDEAQVNADAGTAPTPEVWPAASIPAEGPAVYPLRRRTTSPAPVAPPARVAASEPTSTAVVPPSAGAAPGEAQRAAGVAARPSGSTVGTSPPPAVRSEDSGARTKPPAVIVDDDDVTPLQVRFLRGDIWAPARLRALSLKGARLAAAAPPRLGDRVPITLGLDHLDVMLVGEVTQVTTATQAAGTGEPSGFALHFDALDAPLRGKLVTLLKRAKHSGVSLRPPPPRASVRFPVRWPAGVITAWGELNTAALDVSRSGLFVAAGTAIGTREIVFHMPMDTAERSLSGRAEVAREVTEQMAAQRGLTRGYGMRIIDFTRNDSTRYEGFIDRIRVRTEKRILLAARRERGTEVGRGLVAAGYAVHTGNDLVALAGSVASGGPPPDAALIDAGLLAADPNAAALKRALHGRQVPCLTIGDEQPERARAVVDHLLQIA